VFAAVVVAVSVSVVRPVDRAIFHRAALMVVCVAIDADIHVVIQ
jgi:hypothetical protein